MYHYIQKDLAKHLRKEHKLSPFSTYLREIVYGGNDGIVTTFAVVAGFAGANLSAHNGLGYLTVLLFGLANLFADASSMGLGNLLSMRAEQDRYKQEREKETKEITQNSEIEKMETEQLLMSKGFSQEDAKKLVSIYSRNEDYWVDFMMRYEFEMNDPTNENPLLTGGVTFLSFIVFGAIPLTPYIFFGSHEHTFTYAVIATILALILLGLLRWRVTRDSLWRSVGEILLIGGTSAFIAYIVGTLFRL